MTNSNRRGTDDLAALEERVLLAARRERPSRELQERMARGLGLSAAALAALGESAAASGQSAGSSLAGAGLELTAPLAAKGGLAVVAPWLGGTVLVAALSGAVAWGVSSSNPAEPASVLPSTVSSETALPATAITTSPATAVSLAPPAAAEPPSAAESTPGYAAPSRRAASERGPSQLAQHAGRALREEIALIDAARAAIGAGAASEALSRVNEYDARYPKGAFRPEATALRIEALVRLGRKAEATALARRFIAQRPGTPLAERVARLLGQGGEAE